MHHMYVVGMDVDTKVSTWSVNFSVNLGYLLETSLYIIYTINCPNKFNKTCLSVKILHNQGKISFNWFKNYQQETYLAQNFAFKHTTLQKCFYSTNKILPHHPEKPKLSDDEFGYYLAGLIEGDGHFSKRLEIIFHEKDIAYIHSIRTRIGYGSIYKVKDKRAYKLSIGSKQGFTRIWELVNGKFVADNKIIQFNKNPYGLVLYPANKTVTLSNSWLTGFIAADGGINIIVANSDTHKLGKSCRLTITIAQKERILLDHIKDGLIKSGIPTNKILLRFDGRVYRLKLTDREYTINRMIKYLDKYPFLSAKDIQYMYWRKAFLIMQNEEHLTLDGLNKILEFKSNMANVYK